MTKALARLTLAALAASLCALSAAAQGAPAAAQAAPTPEWVAVSPEGETFAALMPKEPLWLEQDVRAGELAASGRRYTATAPGGARYVVWSLADTRGVGQRLAESYANWRFGGESRYLDLVAEAAWEFLVRPEYERLGLERLRNGAENKFIPRMPLRREFELSGRHAREYAVMLEKEGGPVYVCVDGARLYVVAALAPDPQSPDSRRFAESFAVGAKKPSPPTPVIMQIDPALLRPDAGAVVGGLGPGRGGNTGGGAPPAGGAAGVDYTRPFRPNEVTKKALITQKPEPGFTEGARKFEVTGVVRLRAILSKTGEVTNLSVVKYLPHGLTEKALEAARGIRFTPAQKDGLTVSQYVVLEYNFNIY